ncbi:Aste57867_13544 [Aphanomyces stellatus]|uniref:Aste57867_13544 protein n=1 Tax=Aphanomyces stellatus TaxID=120398 RepID=A0A485KZ50_9STRA|nr:hypothetical protein As57867_013494 [Aphanomyces stellatus]VFT90382.1 Aste57867_13544 [Aphanomyces stellatus]
MEFRVVDPSSIQSERRANNYSPLVCYSYILNTILGVGCLGIPYAVYHAGLVLGIVMLVGGSFLSYLTVLWTCESLERKQAADERRRLLHSDRDPVEVAGLCHEYLGPMAGRLYDVSLYCYGYGVLVAFAQVFIHAVAAQFPHLPLPAVGALFATVVVPLTCIDLTEQIVAQLIMTGLRFVALALMCGSLLLNLLVGPSPTTPRAALPLVDVNGVGLLVSTVVFAQFCHFCVPDLVAPLSNKAAAPTIFAAAMASTTVAYVVLGILSALVFGADVLTSVNLNHFYALPPPLALFVLLFPAADTLSAFPLIAIGVANTLMAATHRSRLFSRLAVAIPPIVLGLVVHDLTAILQWIGVFGVYLVLVAPALLHLHVEATDAKSIRSTSSSFLSHRGWAYTVLAAAAAATLIMIAELV